MKKILKKENTAIILRKEKKSEIVPKKIKPAEIAKKEKPKRSVNKENPAVIEQENPVYLKLRYDESVDSKKDLLFSELSFLTILKIMKRYNMWRKEELRIKSEMFKKMRELDASLQKTKAVFPFLKIPERARRKEVIELRPVEEARPKPIETDYDENLEAQLRDIQARLNSIGR